MITRPLKKIVHRIHPEGYRLLLGVLLGYCIALTISGVLVPLTFLFWLVAVVGGLVLVGLLVFFRNPRRSVPPDRGWIISPADGTVVTVEQVFEHSFIKDLCWKISIFMPPWKPHVNKAPVSGRVVAVQYNPGKYIVAWHPKSSELNERNTVVIEREDGLPVLVRQIAGFIARRIKCYLSPGQVVKAGEDIGFIKFGSRVDVFIPLYARVMVEVDDRVRAGETVLAYLPLGKMSTERNCSIEPAYAG